MHAHASHGHSQEDDSVPRKGGLPRMISREVEPNEPGRSRAGEWKEQLIGSGFCLLFVTTKPDCAGGNNEDDEHHGRHGREPLEVFHIHQ